MDAGDHDRLPPHLSVGPDAEHVVLVFEGRRNDMRISEIARRGAESYLEKLIRNVSKDEIRNWIDNDFDEIRNWVEVQISLAN